MATTQTIADPLEFKSSLETILRDAKGRVFLYLRANNDPATGQSWCPDCRNADPLIQKTIGTIAEATLVYVAVGDKPTWKNADNFYRKDELLRAFCVPTLYEISKDGSILKRLDDPDAQNETKLRALC
ncbi:hypothetical protein HDU76_006861 [Blyttiomyces sp. JEL0837]|nr:hypothetical protein HDU76_006861 [Blyttiomyces sp. JEL0837]